MPIYYCAICGYYWLCDFESADNMTIRWKYTKTITPDVVVRRCPPHSGNWDG